MKFNNTYFILNQKMKYISDIKSIWVNPGTFFKSTNNYLFVTFYLFSIKTKSTVCILNLVSGDQTVTKTIYGSDIAPWTMIGKSSIP